MRSGRLRESLKRLSDSEVAALYREWSLWARPDQLPPDSTSAGLAWRVWLIVGGRGSGKTRAGAEWVRARASAGTGMRIALVGETIAEVRRVMIEGVSGLLAIHGYAERPTFEASKHRLTWPNGSIAEMFSAENREALRGPQFDAAWCDEIAKWREAEATWDMLQFALRLGERPQVVVTTTPRNVRLLKTIMKDEATAISRAPTSANRPNLAPAFIEEMIRRYGGTALGRQELLGEIVEDDATSLWRRSWIDEGRVSTAPELAVVVVAVDPPVTATASSDACGIIVAGRTGDGHAYVLADRSVQGREPQAWARAAVSAYQEFMADRVVAEVNQGGDLVVSVLRQVDEAVPVRKVRATRGKWLRAEPVAALYAEGHVSHVGAFAVLEDQMCVFGSSAWARGKSPDRLDALVWALTDLMLNRKAIARVRKL